MDGDAIPCAEERGGAMVMKTPWQEEINVMGLDAQEAGEAPGS